MLQRGRGMGHQSADRPRRPRRGVIWTPELWERAQRLRAEGRSLSVIARECGVTPHQVQWKFQNEDYRHRTAAARLSEAAVAVDRERRLAASLRMTLTQSVFGDPPPGYSALDRKRAQP